MRMGVDYRELAGQRMLGKAGGCEEGESSFSWFFPMAMEVIVKDRR